MIVRRKYLCGSKNVISARKTTGDKHPHHTVCTCCCHVCSSTCANIKSSHFRSSLTDVLSLTLARACAAKGYCSRSVGLSVGFLSNCGCCRYHTWIWWYMYMYVTQVLGTARVWSGVVQEQHVYGRGLKLYTAIILGVH